MGTLLQEAGLPAGGCPELWNVERPDIVRSVILSYREAGAELLETNTFGGSPHKLGAYDLAARCEELNRTAAEINRLRDLLANEGRLRIQQEGRIEVWSAS